MAERKGLSKQLRFEVFKRDGFKCQYCGKTAPDVILHVDHITPVSKGGEDEILNLITSCMDCNLGKSDRELDDDSVIAKQRAQLEELNERREQLEMMLQWRDSMKNLEEDTVDVAVTAFTEGARGRSSLNERGRKEVRSHIKRYGLMAVLEAIEKATEQYIKFGEDGEPDRDSLELAFRRVGGILRGNTLPDGERQIYYIRGIVRNRMYCNERVCISLLRQANKLGADLHELAEFAKEARNWTQWRDHMESLIEDLRG